MSAALLDAPPAESPDADDALHPDHHERVHTHLLWFAPH